MTDPQDTTIDEWNEFEALRDIKKDGLKESLAKAIEQVAGESITCFACNILGHTNQYDPKLGLDFAKTKLRLCLERIVEDGD